MYLKQNIFTLILIAILMLLGITFIIVSPSVLINIFIFIVATIIIIMGINFLIVAKDYPSQDKNSLFIQSIILITIGIALFVIPKGINEWLFRVIIGIIFIIYPLVNLFTVKYKKEQLKKDLPLYIIGLILVFSFSAILKIVMIVIGSLLLTLGFVLIYFLFKNRNNSDSPNVIFNLGLKYFIKKGSKR